MIGIAAFVGLAMFLASAPGRAMFRGESLPAAGGVAVALVVLLSVMKAG